MVNNLYTVLEKNNQKIIIQLSDEEHPIFQAHFPQHPILPGFALIDIMATILKDEIVYIKQSKFLAPLLPNDIFSCHIISKEHQRNIKIFKNNQKVSHLIYESK